MKKNVNVSEQYRNDNSVRQYNQSQTGQVVGLSDDKWATLDIWEFLTKLKIKSKLPISFNIDNEYFLLSKINK
jgi:hypothetical protein